VVFRIIAIPPAIMPVMVTGNGDTVTNDDYSSKHR